MEEDFFQPSQTSNSELRILVQQPIQETLYFIRKWDMLRERQIFVDDRLFDFFFIPGIEWRQSCD